MPKYFIGKFIVIILSLFIFYCGIAALRAGEIRSRGHKFKRDEEPLGYWFTALVTLVGPIAIIYLFLTR